MKKNAKGIGAGKAGSGKRLIHKAGGGRKAVKTWRSLPKGTRSRIKKTASTSKNYDITKTLKGVRQTRKARGANPVTGKAR